MQKLAMLSVERELDLVVLSAVGDAEGPQAGYVRLAVSSRKSFETMVENFALYRAYPVVAHMAHVVSGKTAGLRVKSAIETRLKMGGRHARASWFRVDGPEVLKLSAVIAEQERVALMTAAQADERELKALAKIMDKMR